MRLRESLQPSGSFKIRGALHAIACLTDAQRAAGVIAYSTGNHAQAVALAARQQGIRATIVMSPEAPAFKVDRTRRFGAEVVMAEPTSAARRMLAEELARSRGLSLIPPYDDLTVMAGQGTIGLEILEHCTPAAVFVPVGGGGLLAGIAVAVKQSAPSVRVIGVEPAWENDAWQSFQTGHKVALAAASDSIADAIRVQTLGDLTYPMLRQYVDEIVTVTEAVQRGHGGGPGGPIAGGGRSADPRAGDGAVNCSGAAGLSARPSGRGLSALPSGSGPAKAVNAAAARLRSVRVGRSGEPQSAQSRLPGSLV